MAMEPTKCKICEEIVPRNIDCQPKTCKACQRFFQRNYNNRDSFTCSKQTGACNKFRGYGCCRFCRITKCIEIGMTKRIQSENTKFCSQGDDGNSVVNRGYNQAFLEPILYDGRVIEEKIQELAVAFTYLHDIHSARLRRPQNAEQSQGDFLINFDKHVDATARSLCSYRNYLADVNNLRPCERMIMNSNTIGLRKVAMLFNGLPSSGGHSAFGVNDSALSNIYNLWPELKKTHETRENVKTMLAQWDPNFPEASLLLGVTVFDQASGKQSPRLASIRRQLLTALALVSQKRCSTSGQHPLENFKQCMQLLDKSFKLMIQVTMEYRLLLRYLKLDKTPDSTQ